MGRNLFGLLAAAAGEKPLSSRFGKWCVAVSNFIDQIGQATNGDLTALAVVITGLTRAGERIFTRLLNPIILTAASRDVTTMTRIDSNGILYDSATGVYTLSGLRYYHLLAHGTVLGVNPTDTLTLEWVNADSNAPIPASGPGNFVPTNFATDARSPNPLAEAFLVAGSNTTRVKLRATALGGATATLDTDFVVSIVEIR